MSPEIIHAGASDRLEAAVARAGSRLREVHVGLHDENGVVIGRMPILMPTKRRSDGRLFVKVFRDGPLETLAADRSLTGEALRVMLCVIHRMDYENRVDLVQIEVAERLGIQPPNVARAIKKLLDAGWLERHKEPHRGYVYRVPSKLAWVGTPERHARAKPQ